MGSVGNVNRSRDMVEWMCYQPLSILWSGLCILHQILQSLNTASNAAQSSPTAIHNENTAMAVTGVEVGSLLSVHAAIVASGTKLLFPVPAGLHHLAVRHGARTAESCAAKRNNRNRHHVLTVEPRLNVTDEGGRLSDVAVASGKRITLAKMAFVPGAAAHAGAIQKYARHVEAYEEQTSDWNQSGVRYAARRSSQRHARTSIAARLNALLKVAGAHWTSVLAIPIGSCASIVAKRTRPRRVTAIRSVVESMPMRGVRRTPYSGHCQQQRRSCAGAKCAAIQLHLAQRKHADRKSASGRVTWRLPQPDRQETGSREHAKSAESCLCQSTATSGVTFILTNVYASTVSESARRQGAQGKRLARLNALIHMQYSAVMDGAASYVDAVHQSGCEEQPMTERQSWITSCRWHMAESTAMPTLNACAVSVIRQRVQALQDSCRCCDGEGGARVWAC